MKHFIVEIDYKAPIEIIEETRQEHRDYLKEGYDKKVILLSGPQVPRIGGIVIARGQSMEDIAEYFSKDPYQVKGLAEYHYIEFKAANYQEFLKMWVEE